MVRSAVLVAVIFGCSSAAHADQIMPLWRTLEYGDTPEVVAVKLAEMPEVKRATAKGGDVRIAWKGEGIEILGEQFDVDPVFKDGKLAQVSISAADTCTNRIEARYARLIEALKEKYATSSIGIMSETDLMQAKVNGTDENPAVLPTIMGNDTNAVILIQKFTRTPPPEAIAVSGKFGRAMLDWAWQNYRTQQAQCDGTGQYRVAVTLSFMPRADLVKRAAEINEAQQTEIKRAAKDL